MRFRPDSGRPGARAGPFGERFRAWRELLVTHPLLFTPITIRGVTARNRVMVSPMCQYASVDGGPTDWHLVNLGRYTLGGAGIVFAEESAVEARGRKTYQCGHQRFEGDVPSRSPRRRRATRPARHRAGTDTCAA